MLIQVFVELIILLVAIYYFSVLLHFGGLTIFKTKDVSFGKALVPFYYWFKAKTV